MKLRQWILLSITFTLLILLVVWLTRATPPSARVINYCPLANGRTWTYRHSLVGTGFAISTSFSSSTQTCSGPVIWHGKSCFAVTQSQGAYHSTIYENWAPNGLVVFGDSMGGIGLPPAMSNDFSPPWIKLPAEVKAGYHWSQTTATARYGELIAGTVMGFTSITVPAGTFQHSLVLTMNITSSANSKLSLVEILKKYANKILRRSVTSTTPFVSHPVANCRTIWYAPGVGMVKEAQDFTTSGGSTYSSITELQKYTK